LYQGLPTLLAVKDMAMNGGAAVVNGAVSAATTVKDTVGAGNLGYVALGVGAAGLAYGAFQYFKPDELRRFQTNQAYTQCSGNEYQYNRDNSDGADSVKCVSLDQFNCGKRIWGSYTYGFLYCADAPAEPNDVDYTDKINAMIAAMQKAAAAATPQQKQAANAAADAAVATEDKAKDGIVQKTDTQLQQVVHNQQAAGTQAVATQAQIETKIAELQEKQAQPGISPQSAAALAAEIAQLQAQSVANAENLKATIAANQAATAQIQANALKAGATAEAKTEAALAQASTKAPLTHARRGRAQTKFSFRGKTTTIHHPQKQYVRAQRQSVAPRKKRAAVKVVGGQYAYYVMPRRAKRCKSGYKQGVSKKGKRTCRSLAN
jgi:hypothetical protein